MEKKFRAGELKVDLHSSALKKELRLVDLVGIQILTIVGTSWIGAAGILGSAHAMYWLTAVLLFYLPAGVIVAHLANAMPLEGGMYQWPKLCFGPMTGFLVAMNIRLLYVIIISSIGLQILGTAPYSLALDASWLATAKPVIIALSIAIICGLMLVAWRGLALGKWISTLGGFGTVFVFIVVILVAVPHWLSGTSALALASLSLPAVSLLNLNILGKMCFGALCGVDSVAVFAGECRSADVGKAIRQSVWISAPMIAAMMVLGTASVITFSRPETIDLLMPPIQVLNLGAPGLAKIGSVLIVLVTLAVGCLGFSVLSRFPMVAG